MSSVRVRSAREAARFATGREAVHGEIESGSSPSSASSESAVAVMPGRRKRVQRGREPQCGVVEGDGRTETKCCETDICLSSAGRI